MGMMANFPEQFAARAERRFWFARADAALYRAKQGGRNRITEVAPSMKLDEFLAAMPQAEAKLLVEIAVEEMPLPVHADQAATHHRVEVGRHKGLHQEIHVGLELPPGNQGRAETLDGHVGEHEQVVEAVHAFHRLARVFAGHPDELFHGGVQRGGVGAAGA